LGCAYSKRGCEIEITIPRDVLEWFVDVRERKTGVVLWRDWNEHYSNDKETKSELRVQMRTAIESFIGHVVARQIRIVHGKGQWLINNDWEEIELDSS
jgi:hypothetical protein